MTLSDDQQAALDQHLAALRERVDPLIEDCQTRAAARLADLRDRLKRREAEAPRERLASGRSQV